MNSERELDLAGIGVGPFNLSLAALLEPIPGIHARFFERKPNFDWHPGMMLAGTRMQTSFLKDLVTPVDPSSRYSFLSYIVEQGRFYRFVNAEFARVPRLEFAAYLRWAASRIAALRFASEAREVLCTDRGFELRFSSGEVVYSKHLAVGTGLRPNVPSWARDHLGTRCSHSNDYQVRDLDVTDRSVAVIGGGQSGAEIFLQLLSGVRGTAKRVSWVSRRAGLEPLDETAFTNEYFTPDYVRHYHELPEERRRALAYAQKLTGDGVSPETLRDLSQALYSRDFLEHRRTPYRILTNREIRSMSGRHSHYVLGMRNFFNQTDEYLEADVVLLATGYRYRLPSCLSPIAELLELDADGLPRLNEDYTARWNPPFRGDAAQHRIYMLNAGRHSHGVPDSQLSLAAWRSAVIVNSLCGRKVYDTTPQPAPLEWVDEQGPMSRRSNSGEVELRAGRA
ncbi:MAG TPA: SidA/IucD/PvdA family monooxygenase [Polyangiaceae bacterium]|nr:SidA/IucD/PvdA family monooxygenase [Polyangiaceae bacterium]